MSNNVQSALTKIMTENEESNMRNEGSEGAGQVIKLRRSEPFTVWVREIKIKASRKKILSQLASRQKESDQMSVPLLRVEELKMHFPVRGGILSRQTGSVKAVDGVSISINEGETLGLALGLKLGLTLGDLVGESVGDVLGDVDGEIVGLWLALGLIDGLAEGDTDGDVVGREGWLDTCHVCVSHARTAFGLAVQIWVLCVRPCTRAASRAPCVAAATSPHCSCSMWP